MSVTETTETSSTEDAATQDVPSWVWWILAAALLLLVIGVPMLLRSRRRRAWQEQLTGCEQEVAWFSRELVPALRTAGGDQGIAGAWAVAGRERVAAVEDRLTALEASAPDEPAADRARALRDAVRVCRTRMEVLAEGRAQVPAHLALDAVVSELEGVLQ